MPITQMGYKRSLFSLTVVVTLGACHSGEALDARSARHGETNALTTSRFIAPWYMAEVIEPSAGQLAEFTDEALEARAAWAAEDRLRGDPSAFESPELYDARFAEEQTSILEQLQSERDQFYQKLERLESGTINLSASWEEQFHVREGIARYAWDDDKKSIEVHFSETNIDAGVNAPAFGIPEIARELAEYTAVRRLVEILHRAQEPYITGYATIADFESALGLKAVGLATPGRAELLDMEGQPLLDKQGNAIKVRISASESLSPDGIEEATWWHELTHVAFYSSREYERIFGDADNAQSTDNLAEKTAERLAQTVGFVGDLDEVNAQVHTLVNEIIPWIITADRIAHFMKKKNQNWSQLYDAQTQELDYDAWTSLDLLHPEDKALALSRTRFATSPSDIIRAVAEPYLQRESPTPSSDPEPPTPPSDATLLQFVISVAQELTRDWSVDVTSEKFWQLLQRPSPAARATACN